jgi:hypothetical protein
MTKIKDLAGLKARSTRTMHPIEFFSSLFKSCRESLPKEPGFQPLRELGFAGAKSPVKSYAGSARLKSCPDTNQFPNVERSRPGTYSTNLQLSTVA